MKAILLTIIAIMPYLLVSAQDKTKVESVVDKNLDPLFYHINYTEIHSKRRPLLRVRKEKIPEVIWKVRPNGFVTTQPLLYVGRLVVGTSTGMFQYINMETGEIDKVNCSAGSLIAYSGLRNDGSVLGMTWVGTTINFTSAWEANAYRSSLGFKNTETPPVGCLAWMGGCIVSQRNDFPVMIEMKEGKAVSDTHRTWKNGEITSPIIEGEGVFWLATSKGELLSFDINLSKITSTIRLEKSYATALVAQNKTIYALSAAKELFAFDSGTNLLKWKITVDGCGVNSMICDKEIIYLNAGNFYIINALDGKILFEQKTLSYERFMRTKPFVTNKRIYTCDSEGNLFIYDKNDYKLIQMINLDEDVFIDFICFKNVIFIPTISGNLYALDVSLY